MTLWPLSPPYLLTMYRAIFVFICYNVFSLYTAAHTPRTAYILLVFFFFYVLKMFTRYEQNQNQSLNTWMALKMEMVYEVRRQDPQKFSAAPRRPHFHPPPTTLTHTSKIVDFDLKPIIFCQKSVWKEKLHILKQILKNEGQGQPTCPPAHLFTPPPSPLRLRPFFLWL